MHILIDRVLEYPILIIAFLLPFASFFSRRTLSIPTTPHILFSATYNHLGSFTLLPPMFGIHGFMHIYAALMCQPIYFPLKNDIKFDCKARTRDSFAFGTRRYERDRPFPLRVKALM